jgi:hypothetical protein
LNSTENPTPSIPSASEYTPDNFAAADRIAASTIHLAHFLRLRSIVVPWFAKTSAAVKKRGGSWYSRPQ